MNGLKLLGHPVHPITVHLTLGALVAASIFDVGAWLSGGEPWAVAAHWALILGLVASVPSVVTGLVDYVAIPRGHRAERQADRHLAFMAGALTVYGLSALARLVAIAGPEADVVIARGASLLGVILLAIGGFYGGQLVYQHGVGVGVGGEQEAERQ
jgi:uncharacterized membrane protein